MLGRKPCLSLVDCLHRRKILVSWNISDELIVRTKFSESFPVSRDGSLSPWIVLPSTDVQTAHHPQFVTNAMMQGVHRFKVYEPVFSHSASPSPLNLSHLRNKVANFIAVKFRHWSDSVNVPYEIIHFAKERFELSFAIASTK